MLVQILQAVKEVVRSSSTNAVRMDVTSVTTVDKETSIKIHDIIKKPFRGKLVTTTIDKEIRTTARK